MRTHTSEEMVKCLLPKGTAEFKQDQTEQQKIQDSNEAKEKEIEAPLG